MRSPRLTWLSAVRPRWFVAAIVALFVAVALLLFYAVPPLMTRGEEFKSAADRLKAENDIRTAGLQLLAGAVLALGAVFTGITLVFNREGQITERFTRAVEQLGNERTDVRLGGIYALERIARDSRRDHEPIMEILSAYVRHNAAPPNSAGDTPTDRGQGRLLPVCGTAGLKLER
jgi:hypothetical protein